MFKIKIFIIVLVVIAISFLVPKFNYNKPRVSRVLVGGFNRPQFLVDFPSPHDRILSYNENLYGDFAK